MKSTAFKTVDASTTSLEDIALLKRLAAAKKRYKPSTTVAEEDTASIYVGPKQATDKATTVTGATTVTATSESQKSQAKQSRQAYTEDSLIQEANDIQVMAPALSFDNAAEWFHFLMPEFQMHDWQYEMLMLCSGYRQPHSYSVKTPYTDDEPLRAIIAAANGSGKDLVLIAGLATWFMVSAQKSKVIATSSSDAQLKYQTEPHIVELCRRANHKFSSEMIKWVEHYITFPELKSNIRLFATNEAGRAEGEHPVHGGRMMLIMNEAKSIKNQIWDALARCSGYSYWLEISSPGQDNGHFYDEHREAINLRNIWPNPVTPVKPYYRRITGDECPHLKQAQKEAIAKQGDLIMRSSWYAEFTSIESDCVIPRHLLEYCDKFSTDYTGSPLKITTPKRIGCDVGAGKDATVMSFWAGNKFVAEERITEKNLMLQIPWLLEQVSKHGFQGCSLIIDDNGVGQAIADELFLRKYNIIRVRAQHRAFNTQEYLNAGAEMYANIRDHAQLKNLGDIPTKTIRELSVRRWQKHNGKYKLFDKEEDKALLDGKSPDSADAMALAWFNLRPHDLAGTKDKLDALIPKPPPDNLMTMDDFLNVDVKRFKRMIQEHESGDKLSLNSFVNTL